MMMMMKNLWAISQHSCFEKINKRSRLWPGLAPGIRLGNHSSQTFSQAIVLSFSNLCPLPSQPFPEKKVWEYPFWCDAGYMNKNIMWRYSICVGWENSPLESQEVVPPSLLSPIHHHHHHHCHQHQWHSSWLNNIASHAPPLHCPFIQLLCAVPMNIFLILNSCIFLTQLSLQLQSPPLPGARVAEVAQTACAEKFGLVRKFKPQLTSFCRDINMCRVFQSFYLA